jgi:hypothetical protein
MSKSMLSMTLSTVALMAVLPGAGTTSPAPALSANVEQCVTAATQADRSVTFTGQMETIAGAHRMAMEMVVQEHDPGEVGFHTLTAAGPGMWQRSEVGLKIYKYVRQVTDLPAPADFRAIVQYRWLDAKGHVLRTTARRTPVCHEPGERPRTEAPAATMPGA